MTMKLNIFTIKKKVDSNHTCLAVIILNSALKNMRIIIRKCFYEFKNIENNVVRHINDNLSDFPSSCESNEEKIRIGSFLKKVRTLLLKRGMHSKKNVIF